MDFMPDPSNLIFNRTEVTSIPDWEKAYDTLGNIPTHEFFAEHAYHMAVDQDPNTCWNTFESKWTIYDPQLLCLYTDKSQFRT